MTKSNRELFFIADGRDPDGQPISHWIYKKGRSFYVSGPNFTEHLCHPSVKDQAAIKREIFLVYQTKVTGTRMPGDTESPSI